MAAGETNVRYLAPFLAVLKWLVIGIMVIVVVKKLILEKRFRSRKKLPGKVVLITGANSGIGFATAVDLAKRKARVILACRDKAKGEEAADRIRKITRNSNVVFKQLDLASLSSVFRFGRMILTSETRLDVLINNAGLMACTLCRSEDGYEMQFAVNYLGHFLLTLLLINLLKKSKGRIINLTSYMYKMGRINFNDLNSERSYDPWKAFYQSKLAVMLFTRELSKRLKGSEATVNAVHPGIAATNHRKHTLFRWPGVRYLISPVIWFAWKSVEQAASSVVYLVISNKGEDTTGSYFSDFKVQPVEENGMDEGVAKKLWEKSLDLVGLQKCNL